MARKLNWLQRTIGRAMLRAAKYAGIPLRDPALVAMLGSQPSAAGVDVDENTAMNYSAVYSAIDVISSTTGAMPVAPYKATGKAWNVDTKHPAYYRLRISPNDRMTPGVFHETMQSWALGWGNAYAAIDWEDGPGSFINSIDPLPPNQVNVMRDDDGEPFYHFQAHNPGETTRDYDADEIIHIKGLSWDGIIGFDTIQLARESIGLGMAAEKFGAAYFGRGTTPFGWIKYSGDYTEKAKKNFRESFESLHRGPDNAHRIGILDEGMEFVPYPLSPEVAQFLSTRSFQVVEIARWFRIPPHLLRDLSGATFTNIEHQGLDFLTYTLRPWLTKWQEEYHRKLFIDGEREAYQVRHDYHALLATDTVSRYNAYSVGRNGGWLTLNDILHREGMNPLPPEIGDKHLAPSTMRVLESDDPSSPITPEVLHGALELVQALMPVPDEVVQSTLKALMPQITPDLAAGLIAKLKSGPVQLPKQETKNDQET